MSDHPTPLSGTCSARFDPLRELFAAKLESGEDLGASLALNIDGEMVVDLWGGWADESRTAPRTEHAWASSLPHTMRGRSAPTSKSACRPRTTIASPPWCRPRRQHRRRRPT